jgi:hypothetical protein
MKRLLSLTPVVIVLLFLSLLPASAQPSGRRSTVRARRMAKRGKLRQAGQKFRSKFSLRAAIPSILDSTPAASRDAVAHGSWFTRKAMRELIHGAKHSDHGRKHLKAKTEVDAAVFSERAAQYLPGVDNTQLERRALQHGLLIDRGNGGVWGIFRFNKPVGYDGGEKTNWIRAELSSGTIHGHPMRPGRVGKYVRENRGSTPKKKK